MEEGVVQVSTPARIDIAGGWTDGVYPDCPSQVLNCAVNLRLEITVIDNPQMLGVTFRVINDREKDKLLFPDTPFGGWYDLVLAAVKRYGLDGLIVELWSQVPWGSGLGGSGAAAVALAVALSKLPEPPASLADLDLSSSEGKRALALEARAWETEEMGVTSGWQDQLAAVFGGINFFEAQNNEKPKRTPVELTSSEIKRLEDHLLLVQTPRLRQRQSSKIQQGEIRREVLPLLVEDAGEAFSCLQRGDFPGLGQIMIRTWETICNLTFNRATTPDMERLENFFRSVRGVYGWKACGAGGSGACMVAIVDSAQKTHIEEELQSAEWAKGGFRVLRFGLDFEGLRFETK